METAEPKTREQVRFEGAQRGEKTVKAMTLDDMQKLSICHCIFVRCGGCGNIAYNGLTCACGDRNPGK